MKTNRTKFFKYFAKSCPTPTFFAPKKCFSLGRGCGAVGRAVASDTRDPWFKSGHQQLNVRTLLSVNCNPEKTKIKKKRPGMAQLKKYIFAPKLALYDKLVGPMGESPLRSIN